MALPYCAAPGCHDPRTYLYGRLEDGSIVSHEHAFPDEVYELLRVRTLSVEPLVRLCRIHARQVYGVAQADTLPPSHKCQVPDDLPEPGVWVCPGCGSRRVWRGDRWA